MFAVDPPNTEAQCVCFWLQPLAISTPPSECVFLTTGEMQCVVPRTGARVKFTTKCDNYRKVNGELKKLTLTVFNVSVYFISSFLAAFSHLERIKIE